ncbi:tetratricopeptide repeat protein, partial [candidate division KSB1 bacterium]|nr:tetratricopeptide repeat protein [candidate division KSB1 bacterium]
AVQNIPLIVTDYDHQYRIGLSYKITHYGPEIFYAHHFQREDDTSHMGLAFQPFKNIQLYAGLEQFSYDYAAMGIQIKWNNVAANICYDRKTKRVIFSSCFRIGEAPEIIAQESVSRASAYLKDGDRKSALKWSNKALVYDPENTDAQKIYTDLNPVLRKEAQKLDSLLTLANSLVKRGRYMSAAANLKAALKIDPMNQLALDAINTIRPKVNTHSERWFKLGVQSFENQEYTQAKDIFESIILVRSDHEESQNYISKINDILMEQAREHYFTGVGFYNQGNVQEAEAQFREALKAVPNYLDALEFLNRITDEKQSRLRKASELLVEAIDFENDGDLLNAQRRYQEILRLHPGHRSASERMEDLEKRIDVYVKKQMSQAISLYKKSKYSRSQKILSYILALRPDHREARTYYNRINQRTQDRFTGYFEQGKTHFANKNWQAAKTYIDSALTVNPRSAEAKKLRQQADVNFTMDSLMEKGTSAYLSGSYNEALSLYNQVLGIDPENKDALEFKQKCMSLLAEQVDVIFNNGIRLYTEEKYRLAIAEFEKALEINPDHKGSLEYVKRARDRLEALNRLSK